MSGSAARAQATREYALTSTASQKRSRGVSVKRPSRSSAAAKATEWTSRSSSPPNASPTSPKTRATSSSERTSHSVTSGDSIEAASSRTVDSIRSPWYVKASCAPPSASRRAMAQAIERRLATPSTSPRFPSNGPAMAAILLAELAASLLLVRRALLLLGLCAAFAAPATAAATGFPLQHLAHLRPHGPRVRPGTIQLQPSHPRVRVIAALSLPPLARRYGRGLYAFGGRRKLAVRSSTARAYLTQLAAAQDRAVQQLRTEIPAARVEERFRILLDAVTVSVPD